MSLTRRGFLLGSVLAAVGQAVARPIRGSRAAPSNTVVPDAPLWNTLTGGSGQFVAVWYEVTTLIGGAAISANPITSYTVRWGTTEASVQFGGTPTGTTTTASLTATRTGLAAGTWWVVIVATNASGNSDYSFAQSVTVS